MVDFHPVELPPELRRSEWYADGVDVAVTEPPPGGVDGSAPERVVAVAGGDDVPDVLT